MITTEVAVMVISRRGKGGWFGVGDKAVEVSVGSIRMRSGSDQDFKWEGNL